MKRVCILVALLTALCLGACRCPEIGNAVEQVRQNQELIFPAYLDYVQKDSTLDKDQKDDRVKLIEATRRAMDALKRAAEQ